MTFLHRCASCGDRFEPSPILNRCPTCDLPVTMRREDIEYKRLLRGFDDGRRRKGRHDDA
jgi:hypothetical protein